MNAYEVEKDEKEFEDMLNDTFGTVDVCGMTMDAGTVLRECDPIAFRCALSDEPIIWACGECDEQYETEEEANECCQEEAEND